MASARQSAARGLTLVELMVAMGLSSLVILALLAYAQTQTAIQRQTQQATALQANVQAAVEEMSTSLRAAGSSFTAGFATNAVPPGTPTRVLGVTVQNNVLGAPGGDGPDALLVLVSDDAPYATLLDDAAQGTTPLVVDGDAGLRQGDFLLLSDFTDAVLYRLTQDPAAATFNGEAVTHLAVTPPVATPPTPFFKGAKVFRARPLVYRLDTNVIEGLSVLTLQDGAPFVTSEPPQIVAEHIEDLQVAIGIDGLWGGIRDGVLQEIGKDPDDDEWVYNRAGETLPDPLPAGSVITAVRVTVIGRGSQPGDQLTPGRPAVEDRPAGPPDNFRRRLLTAQIYLRASATK
jgi:type II secretory pathway pseudopilin PulG